MRAERAIPHPIRKQAWRLLYHLRDRALRVAVGCKTDDKIAALTFDDGPSAEYTPRILEVLGRAGVKATFFMVGEHVAAHADIAAHVARAGHAVGNHTFTHRRLIGCDAGTVTRELNRCATAIDQACHVKSRLLRMPFGEQDVKSFVVARALGYQLVNWSASGDDWRGDESAHVVDRVVTRLERGGIALLHDGYGRPQPGQGGQGVCADRTPTVQALPVILDKLVGSGYRLVTVHDLLRWAPVALQSWF